MAKKITVVEKSKEYGKNIHATPRSVEIVSAINKLHGIRKYKIVDSAILEYAEKHFQEVL